MLPRSRDAVAQFKRQVFAGASPVRDLDPAEWRRDDSWNLMRFSDFGLTYSEYGWDIQYIVPLAAGGRELPANCRPVHIARAGARRSGGLRI